MQTAQHALTERHCYVIRYKDGSDFKWIRRYDDRKRLQTYTDKELAHRIARSMRFGEVYDLMCDDINSMLIRGTE